MLPQKLGQQTKRGKWYEGKTRQKREVKVTISRRGIWEEPSDGDTPNDNSNLLSFPPTPPEAASSPQSCVLPCLLPRETKEGGVYARVCSQSGVERTVFTSRKDQFESFIFVPLLPSSRLPPSSSSPPSFRCLGFSFLLGSLGSDSSQVLHHWLWLFGVSCHHEHRYAIYFNILQYTLIYIVRNTFIVYISVMTLYNSSRFWWTS